MSNSNYPPQGPYPGSQGGYPQGKPAKVPPPIPLPGGATPEYGAPTPPPYPGQQNPQQFGQPAGGEQYPQQYQGQPYGGGQYQGGSFQPPPPKKKFPVWGWLVIGIPLLGVIAVVIALVAVNMQPTPVAAPSNTASQAPRPRPSTQSVPTPSSPVTPGSSSSDSIKLTTLAPYTSSADWTKDAPSGWKFDAAVGSGNRFSNANGCLMLLAKETLKSTDLGATSKSSDLLASVARAITSKNTFRDKYSDFKDQSLPTPVYISTDKVGGTKLQFYPKTFTYTNTNGVKVRLQLAFRAMPLNHTILVASMACAASVSPGPDGWNGVLDDIYTTGS